MKMEAVNDLENSCGSLLSLYPTPFGVSDWISTITVKLGTPPSMSAAKRTRVEQVQFMLRALLRSRTCKMRGKETREGERGGCNRVMHQGLRPNGWREGTAAIAGRLCTVVV